MWPPYELLFVFRLTCCHQLVRGPNWKKYQLREVYHHLSIRGGLLAEEIKQAYRQNKEKKRQAAKNRPDGRVDDDDDERSANSCKSKHLPGGQLATQLTTMDKIARISRPGQWSVI
ncbi:DNA repair protein [Trichinella spiralis]|uniref:DNA repair protein n=1 Tax=Trichinella spiralis TaxID=6334 RepID=A0ABR3KR12_TRISP